MDVKRKNAFSAVIFALDGVITKTAVTHAAAWKKTFDNYLRQREKEFGETFYPFTRKDYLDYVDGKPRYKGVASFLASRGIEIPWGTPDDDPGEETVCGLGNHKNKAFNELLKKDGVEVYPSTLVLIKELKSAGIKLGVASSSKNCKAVLEAVDLQDTFGARVDGVVSAQWGLKGKPKPDIFVKACELLGTEPAMSVVVEDAVSGVQAGSKGGFGLTLGVARKGNIEELLKNGADSVVNDLEELNGMEGLNDLFLSFNPK
jgi:beta-phosphoglucomutase family hydrolase